MDDKITIIEGPAPQFETIQDGWTMGLNEGPMLYDTALTRLRTFNGPALVERCHRTWRANATMYLEYRNELGMPEQAPILAARNQETDDGHMLVLWVRREAQETGEQAGPTDEENNV
jgi:hypothetical protein